MGNVVIAGVGMTPFGKFLDKSLKELASEAFWNAAKDAGIDPRAIQFACVGNSQAGMITGQESMRGQVIMNDIGLMGIPILNVENACASGSSAFWAAHMAVSSGMCDIALALGVEKLYCGDTAKSLQALATCTDVEMEGRMGVLFAGNGAMHIKHHMRAYGTTIEQVAKIAVKNHRNGALNPYAQYRNIITVEDVLTSRVIADPLRLYMVAPIGDGAAAAILCSEKVARTLTTKPVTVAASVLLSGHPDDVWMDENRPGAVERAAKLAYEKAGVGPEDIDVAEVHDAMVAEELFDYEYLGFCPKGEGGRMVEEGRTDITGDHPVNTSGGLTSRGHPLGATGIAQLAELVWQLRGEASTRQVADPTVGLAENGGGEVGGAIGSMMLHILKR